MRFYKDSYEEDLPGWNVLYMRRTGPYGPENRVLMTQFKSWLKTHKRLDENTVIWAIALDNPAVTQAEKCRYDVCTETTDDWESGCEDVKTRLIQGGKYLVFRVEHTAEALQRAWAEYSAEVAQKKYTVDVSRPVLERYDPKLAAQHMCELCIPILCIRKNVAKNLQRYMKEHNRTWAAMADEIGAASSSLENYLKGEVDFRTGTLERIAAGCKMSVAELISDSPEEDGIIACIAREKELEELPPEKQKTCAKLLLEIADLFTNKD